MRGMHTEDFLQQKRVSAEVYKYVRHYMRRRGTHGKKLYTKGTYSTLGGYYTKGSVNIVATNKHNISERERREVV